MPMEGNPAYLFRSSVACTDLIRRRGVRNCCRDGYLEMKQYAL